MTTPQSAIQQTSKTCASIARSLLASSEMLAVARPDSTIVTQSQINLRRLAVELNNASVELQQALLTGGAAE
jgi:hypothetical protein